MEPHSFKDASTNVQNLAARKFRQATNVAGNDVSNNPWKTIGIAAAMGALIGFLAAKR